MQQPVAVFLVLSIATSEYEPLCIVCVHVHGVVCLSSLVALEASVASVLPNPKHKEQSVVGCERILHGLVLLLYVKWLFHFHSL